MKSIAIITSNAISLINFRGPLITSLTEIPIKVFAFAPDFDDDSRRKIIELGAEPVDIKLSRTGLNPISDSLHFIRLTLTLRRYKPDIVFSYFVKPVVYGTLAAWLAGIHHRFAMIEGLGYVFTPTTIKLQFSRRVLLNIVSLLYRISLAKSEKVIFLNKDDINDFVNRGLIDPSKAILLGGIGVDLSEWSQAEIVDKPISFIMIARLLREKGVREFAAAAKFIRKTHPEVSFILLGGLDENPGSISLKEVDEWVANGSVKWQGHANPKRWLKESSVFVLPSYREGFPRSTQEAMAMGRPVITTNTPGCRETVIDGVNGYLIPPQDVHALVSTMMIFIETPEIIRRMGHSSRKIAEKFFDVHIINTKILRILGIIK